MRRLFERVMPPKIGLDVVAFAQETCHNGFQVESMPMLVVENAAFKLVSR